MSTKCEHINDDGSFKGGFDGCVLHMTSECGGGHSEESAKKICGSIAANKATRQRTEAEAEYVALHARLPLELGSFPTPKTDVRTFMYMPAGRQTITCGLGDDAVAEDVVL